MRAEPAYPARWASQLGHPRDYGGQVSFDSPNSPGIEQSVFSCDGLSAANAVTLTLNREDEWSLPDNCDIRATIQLGSGGVTRTIEADWTPGLQVTAALSGQVRVGARSYAPIPGLPYARGDRHYRLGASIGQNSALHPSPRLTQRVPLSESGNGQVRLVNWSDAVMPAYNIDVEGSSVPQIAFRWLDGQNNPFAGFYSQDVINQFVPIPGGARALSIFYGIDDPPDVTLIWRLTL